MTEAHLKPNFDYLFGLVHLNEDWIAPVLKATEETTCDEARFKPAEGVATIWEITLHMCGWMEDLLHDLSGSPDAGVADWPLIDDDCPTSWKEAQQKCRSLVVLLKDQLDQLCDESLDRAINGSEATKAQRIGAILIHNSYHAGQIIKIRQIYHARNASKSQAAAAV